MRVHCLLPELPARKTESFFGNTMLLAAALVLTGLNAQARAQNYQNLKTGLGAPGVVSPDGSVITFPLVRQDLTSLTVKLAGMPAVTAVPEAVAYGYVNVEQVGAAGTYFIDGAFPAVAAELPMLEESLQLTGLSMTAVADATAGLSKSVFTVHVEGTLQQADVVIASSLATALATIKSPQKNVSVLYPGVVYTAVPKKFLSLVQNGQFELIDYNAIVFSLPRNDTTPLMLGSIVANPSLGVGQTVLISGDGNTSLVTAELALLPHEVAKAQALLLAGGWTISAQGDYFTDDSKRLTFLHAVASAGTVALFQAQMEALGEAIKVTVK